MCGENRIYLVQCVHSLNAVTHTMASPSVVRTARGGGGGALDYVAVHTRDQENARKKGTFCR